MRRDGIPYVANPKGYYPPVDYKKLSLDELVNKFIKVCAKASGKVAVCSQCQTPCEYGKRAIQLTANAIYDDPPIPLYGGKTLIEQAKEENMRKRAAAEVKKVEEQMTLHAENSTKENTSKKKRKYLKDEEWWDQSLESGDQVKYLMDNYGLSRTQAKRRIYERTRRYDKDKPIEMPVLKSEPKEEPQKPAPQKVSVSSNSNDLVTKTFEAKIGDLMSKQAEYKAKIDEYTKLYKEVSEQIDVLCKAMDVFDKT